MRLKSSFVKLRYQFDKKALQEEVAMLPDEAWRPHPQGFEGNSAVTLIARNGDANDDRTSGPMKATEWLAQLPYVQQVMASLQAPLGRSRLMRIQGDSQVPCHTDLDYYWQRRMRVHIPIITNEGVQFECGDDAVHMAPGETWVFDTTQLHRVRNPQGGERIHLVVDTVGSDHLFGLFTEDYLQTATDSLPAQTTMNQQKPSFESHNTPAIMSPHEQREILCELLTLFSEELDDSLTERVNSALQPIMHDWNAAWAEHGPNRSGLDVFQALQKRLSNTIEPCAKGVHFRGSPVSQWLRHWLIEPALNLDLLTDNKLDLDQSQSDTKQLGDDTAKDEASLKSYASQYTESFPGLIAHLGGTLVVSTYASNRVVLLRSEGDQLNTHFKEYAGAMGMAYDGNRLALGGQNAIWLFRSQPDLCTAIQPNCDAVYVPNKQHFTGDIRVHELGWSEDELWMVNTRFSCLATLDHKHSFVPRWHPKFIDKLNAEDACHLNGMAMRDGKPAWVTALGVSDSPGGWRENKLEGGVVMDVESDEIVTAGLCMPHSPRWHGGSLWVLDSGLGELCQVDLNNGKRQSVARFPGFTRGLAMIDRYAFVGCSRVREKAWFGGLPILEREEPPACGVWAVDLVTGETVGWLKFEEGIDEIFDLQWLPQLRWPDILEPHEETARNGFVLPEEKLTRFL